MNISNSFKVKDTVLSGSGEKARERIFTARYAVILTWGRWDLSNSVGRVVKSKAIPRTIQIITARFEEFSNCQVLLFSKGQKCSDDAKIAKAAKGRAKKCRFFITNNFFLELILSPASEGIIVANLGQEL